MSFRPLALALRIAAFLLVLVTWLPRSASSASPLEERVQRILQQAPVTDAHADTVLQIFPSGIDLGVDLAGRQTDLPKLLAGGVGLQVFAIFTDPGYGSQVLQQTHTLLNLMKAQIERHSDKLELVRSAGDIRRIREQGKIAALLSLEGGHALAGRLANLDRFYGAGVRSLTLTWMYSNVWADSSTDQARWGGLSPPGVQLVRRMNDLGMIIDVSHTADATVRDVLQASRVPIIASHSSCAALFPHRRNLSDDLLRAISRRGGVIALNFFPNYLDGRFFRQNGGLEGTLNSQRLALYRKYRGRPAEFAATWRRLFDAAMARVRAPVTVARLADHIDHAVRVAGIDHVGLGSDFDGAVLAPRGLEDASRYGNLVRELLRRGYSEEAILKILGGNLRRVFEQVLVGVPPHFIKSTLVPSGDVRRGSPPGG